MSDTHKPKKAPVLPVRVPKEPSRLRYVSSESTQPPAIAQSTLALASTRPRLLAGAFGTTSSRLVTPNLQTDKAARLDLDGVHVLDKDNLEEEMEIDDSGHKAGKPGNSSGNDEMEGDVGSGSEGDEEDTGAEDGQDRTLSPPPLRRKMPVVPKFKDQDALDAHIARIQAHFNKKKLLGRKGGEPKVEKGKPKVETGLMKAESGTVETEGGEMKAEGESQPTTQANGAKQKALRRTKGAHSLKVMLSLTGLTRAKEAAKIEPLHDKYNNPVYLDDNGLLVPNFGQSFDVNYAAWGEKYASAVANPTHMDASDREVLQAVSVNEFRDILRLGAFATMKDVWKANQGGKGEEREKKKNATSRHGQRKATKAENRMQALIKSDLPMDEFRFLADPGFQSPSHSDPENDKRLEIWDPCFRSDEAQKLLLSLDQAHHSHKKRAGKPRYTTTEYVRSNVPVPALTKTEGKIPLWVVQEEWLKNNPSLEKESRKNIDYKKSQMPHADKVKQYLHTYEADAREYVKNQESAPELDEAPSGSASVPIGLLAPASTLFHPCPPASATMLAPLHVEYGSNSNQGPLHMHVKPTHAYGQFPLQQHVQFAPGQLLPDLTYLQHAPVPGTQYGHLHHPETPQMVSGSHPGHMLGQAGAHGDEWGVSRPWIGPEMDPSVLHYPPRIPSHMSEPPLPIQGPPADKSPQASQSDPKRRRSARNMPKAKKVTIPKAKQASEGEHLEEVTDEKDGDESPAPELPRARKRKVKK
ncbi:hypothetical protein RSOL_228300, partial [Rhizoctonia solani AG-3 Rhs1AP]